MAEESKIYNPKRKHLTHLNRKRNPPIQEPPPKRRDAPIEEPLRKREKDPVEEPPRERKKDQEIPPAPGEKGPPVKEPNFRNQKFHRV